MAKSSSKDHKPRKKEEGFGFHTIILLTIFFFVVVTLVVVVLWIQMEFLKNDMEGLRNGAEVSYNFLRGIV